MVVDPAISPSRASEQSHELLEARTLAAAERQLRLFQVAQTAENLASTERRVAATFAAMAEAGGPRAAEHRRLAREASRCAAVAEQRARQLREGTSN